MGDHTRETMPFRKRRADALTTTRYFVLLFIALLVAMVLVVNVSLFAAWWLTTGGMKVPNGFYFLNSFMVVGYVLLGWWIEHSNLKKGGVEVAEKVGAREIEEAQNIYEKRARNVVYEVAVATGVRPPRVFIMDGEDAINAFTAGWSINDAVIVLTEGAVERLTRDELQGVVAHEFSHILHGDVRLNMRMMSLVLGLQLLHGFGSSVIRAGADGARYIWVKNAFGYMLMGVGWLGWLAGQILGASISRQREFLADASAVQYTRYVEGIAGALRKIAFQIEEQRAGFIKIDLENFAPLFFQYQALSKLLRTHPPISERLKSLGVSYTRYKEKDDIQEFSIDDFMPARLVADGVLTPHLKMMAARWGGVGLQRDTLQKREKKREQGLDVEPVTAEDFKGAEAELYLLHSNLTPQQVKAAILAYWVRDEEGETALEQWKQYCRAEGFQQLPLKIWTSVQHLPLRTQEPAFEWLCEIAQTFTMEERLQLAEQGNELFELQEQKTVDLWLRTALLNYWMGEFRESMSSRYSQLSQIQQSVADLTALLGGALRVESPRFWVQQVLKTLGIQAEYREEITDQDLHNAVAEVHHGNSLLAPQIVWAWQHCFQAQFHTLSEKEKQQAANLLVLFCGLLDTARPQSLKAYFTPVNGAV